MDICFSADDRLGHAILFGWEAIVVAIYPQLQRHKYGKWDIHFSSFG
jgi:hypothetical protein